MKIVFEEEEGAW